MEGIHTKDSGDFEYKFIHGDFEVLTVSFFGIDGANALWKLQGLISEMFMSTAEDAKSNKRDVEKDKDQELQSSLLIKGISIHKRKPELYRDIMTALEKFGTMGAAGEKLSRNTQQKLHIEDIDKICEGVIEVFLLQPLLKASKNTS